MPTGAKIPLVVSVFGAVILTALIYGGPVVQQRFFYPKPQALPAVVKESTGELLARLQRTLEAKAPAIACHLQPGLTEEEIRSLESAGDFKLPQDIRTFYRWHNGLAQDSPDGLLPGQHFLPLEHVVRERTLLKQQLEGAGFLQRISVNILAGHRASWVHVLDDGASDGYFVDPRRPDSEGSFFYNFSEVRHYTWFPSFRNFLAGLIECYDTGAVRISQDGKSLEDDQVKTQKIWRHLALSSEI